MIIEITLLVLVVHTCIARLFPLHPPPRPSRNPFEALSFLARSEHKSMYHVLYRSSLLLPCLRPYMLLFVYVTRRACAGYRAQLVLRARLARSRLFPRAVRVCIRVARPSAVCWCRKATGKTERNTVAYIEFVYVNTDVCWPLLRWLLCLCGCPCIVPRAWELYTNASLARMRPGSRPI